jgi:hypothetical protein
VSIVRTFTRRCKFDSCPVPPRGLAVGELWYDPRAFQRSQASACCAAGAFLLARQTAQGGSGNGPPCDDLRAGGRIITPALLDFGKCQ